MTYELTSIRDVVVDILPLFQARGYVRTTKGSARREEMGTILCHKHEDFSVCIVTYTRFTPVSG